MAVWNEDVVDQIGAADDLHVAPLRDSGTETGTPTWIWSVVVDDRLFVRAWNGTRSRWYQAAMRERAGRIHTVRQVFEVEFAPVDAALQDRIDAAYEQKYRGSAYLPPMLQPGPRAASVEITPRG